MSKRTWYTIGVLMTIAMISVASACFMLALSGRVSHWFLTAILWIAGAGALVVASGFISGMIGGYQSGGRAR